MELTSESVLALAPDASSVKAAQALLKPGQWPTLGFNENAVWGECKGSGSKPYQVEADLSGPVFKCTCPSRKFPCKHSLALLLLRVQQEAAFTQGEAPDWVKEWLDAREKRAARQEQNGCDDRKPQLDRVKRGVRRDHVQRRPACRRSLDGEHPQLRQRQGHMHDDRDSQQLAEGAGRPQRIGARIHGSAATRNGRHRQHERESAHDRHHQKIDGHDNAMPPNAGAEQRKQHALDDLQDHGGDSADDHPRRRRLP